MVELVGGGSVINRAYPIKFEIKFHSFLPKYFKIKKKMHDEKFKNSVKSSITYLTLKLSHNNCSQYAYANNYLIFFFCIMTLWWCAKPQFTHKYSLGAGHRKIVLIINPIIFILVFNMNVNILQKAQKKKGKL